jgi:Protein of unknown function (DUF1616)
VRNRSLDLIGAAGLALVAVAVVLGGAPVAVCSILGVPLVLLVPGYVWVEVFFDSRLSAELRAVLSVALSLTITALGGVLLTVSGIRLDRSSWLALLAGTTFAGVAVAATSRARVRIAPPVDPIEYSRPQRMSVTQVVRLGIAGLLGAAALGIAVYSANAQAQPPYTQLSLGQHGSAPETAQVVLGNHEQGAQRYRLVVTTDGVASKAWTVTLAEGANWQGSVPARPGQRLAVDVYRTLSSGPPYRHVALSVPLVGAK